MRNILWVIFIALVLTNTGNAYLHTEGNEIVNSAGTPILLKGVGLGGWLVPEGYMLHVPGYGSPTSIRNRIIDLIGESGADDFFQQYRQNYVAAKDIDSIASWGYNSIRLPFHYKILSSEPGVYSEEGFAIIDSLLAWCQRHEIYLILDMHCAPGGQNSDNISDSDGEAKLWTQPANQDWTVELWHYIAERYANEEWIGGYDLLNEPVMPSGYNNSDLRALYMRLKNSIREVDNNHILFIEGNWYATDFNQLTPPFDGNMVYAFHKYWNDTSSGTISQYLNLRNQWGVPLWLGESGENSNPWFYQTIQMLEGQNIGWNWWTHKKVASRTCPLSAPLPDGYARIIDYWNGNASEPTQTFARNALMELAENLKIDSCAFQPDVLHALFDDAFGSQPVPRKHLVIPGLISAADYDFGTEGVAYHDNDYINTSGSPSNAGNRGGAYRNDGVDIEETEYNGQPRYSIGFIEDNEWIHYTVDVQHTGNYTVRFRVASPNSTGQMRLSLDNQTLVENINIPGSGGWHNWSPITIDSVNLTQGQHSLKISFPNGGFNLLDIQFIATANGVYQEIDDYTLIGQNYPNPFNKSTTIPILISQQTPITLSIYDIKGRLVRKLYRGNLSEGKQKIIWDGTDESGNNVASGTYMYEVQVNGSRKVHRMMLLK